MTATLFDFRDLDLLLKLEADADDEGWVETVALAHTLGLGDDGIGAVGRRLGWMRKYGMVQFDPQRRMWRLTPNAQRVTTARVRAATAKQLEALPEESMIEVMANVTTTYRLGDPMIATMLRREFLYGTQPGMRTNGSRRRRR